MFPSEACTIMPSGIGGFFYWDFFYWWLYGFGCVIYHFVHQIRNVA
jgi:hypothetical protein